MIAFAHPSCLFLLLLVPPLLGWWLGQRRNALRYPAANLLDGLPRGHARVARFGGALLRALVLTVLILALAGPRFPDQRSRIDTEGIAVIMLVDVSGSMGERDFLWNGEAISRLDAVKRAFHLFVEGGNSGERSADGFEPTIFEGRPTDLIGMVTFAARPETIRPLTLEHAPLLHALDEEQPRRVPGESETNLSDALAVGLERLRSARPQQRKVLMLLTDGEHNVAQPRSTWTPRQAAHVAASLQIPVYTLDAGNDTAGPEVRAGAVKTLEDLAHITNGKYFQAKDTNGLLQACRSIDELERTPIQSFQYKRYYEAHGWFGLAAFVGLALTFVLERTAWRKLP